MLYEVITDRAADRAVPGDVLVRRAGHAADRRTARRSDGHVTLCQG